MMSRIGVALAVVSLALVGCRASPESTEGTLGGHVGGAHPNGSAALFANGGFEDGGTGGAIYNWTITNYLNTSGPTCADGGDCANFPPTSQTALNLGTAGNGTNTTSAIAGDGGPNTAILGIFDGGSAVRYPFFGSWSALVNDRSGSRYPAPNYASNANVLSQSFVASAADVDPLDGNIHVRFVFQPDLEDGSHTPVQQAYFFVQVKNVTTNTTLRTQYFYANQPGVNFFVENTGSLSGNPVDYTNWILFDVPSTGGSISLGDTIQTNVVASGCVPGGHAGEVAVDGFGSTIPGLNVTASGPGLVLVNGNIQYNYVIRNGGATPDLNTTVTQPIPPGTAFKSVSLPSGATCSSIPAVGATSGNLVCNFGSLAAGASNTFSVTVTAPAAASNDVPNGYYFVAADNAPALVGPKVDTRVSAASTAANSADLAMTISDGVPAIAYGSKPTYTITITNAGPAESTSAVVTVPLPAGATNTNWICFGNSPNATIVPGHANTGSGAATLSTMFDLKSGASGTCTYTVTAPASGASPSTFVVTGNVSDNTLFDPNSANNSATDTDEITAAGNIDTISVTTSGTGGGTVTSNPAGINCSANSGTCSDPFANGVAVTLTATPVAGSTFGGWTGLVTCSEGQASQTCTFTPSGNVSATATFTQITYAVTTSTTPASGGGTLTCPSNPAQGTNVSCTVGAATGYRLTSLLDNGSDVTGNVMNNGAYTIANIQANHALSAVFTQNTFPIEATSGANGAISPQGIQTVSYGATPTFNFTPATGYHVADVQVDGVSQGAGPSYTFAPVTAPHAINVDYAINTYTLTPSTGANGTVSPAVAQTAVYGSSQTFAISPASGYQIATLTVDGASVTPASSYTFANISANHTLAATFSRIAYVITPSAGANGSISPNTPQTVNAGANSTFTITPAAGYQVASVLVDGSPVGAPASYTFSNVQAAHSISATFSIICSADGDCSAGNFCDTNQTPHACVPKLTGGTCQRSTQCSTGDCVDGVCCDTACNGQCQACDVTGHVGTCTTVSSGEPHGNRATCAGGTTVCAGTCDGTSANSCDYPAAATTCAPAACVNGAAAPVSTCGGNGSCVAATPVSCVNYACATGGTSCNAVCSKDTDCNAADYCNGAHACVPKGPSGNATTCTADAQCAGGHCTDGFCCNVACDGQCQACDVTGSQGTCILVAAGQAPHGGRTACANDDSGCGGACSGNNALACGYPGAGTSCRAPSCTTGSATLAAGCNGAGECPPAQVQACTPYLCGVNACNANCIADTDCISGDWCAGGVCAPVLKPGVACAGNDQCASGFCVDGVCCNTSCNGQCEACDATGSKGTCAPVAGAPRGPRNACATDNTACGGTCDGSRTTACTYPSASTSCRAASCDDGTAVLAAGCNGAGACPGVQDVNCGAYQCGAVTCRGNCTLDTDCATGSFCAAGVCTTKGTPGATCGASDQCATGNCVDGVCCDTACDGQCAACDVAGKVGTCTALPAGAAPEGMRNPCGSDGSSCGGACDGTTKTACAYPTSSCRDASCSGGTATLGASCDGSGHCPPKSTQACGQFICGANACAGNCTTDASCASGSFCSAGICVPRENNGGACTANSDCASSECVDGVCCNVACDGQCEACNQAGSVGTCKPVMGDPQGARLSCLTDGSACGGRCDGSNVVTCSYPGASTQCRGGSCSSGVATSAAGCNGSGSCPSSTQTACGDYNCSGASCGTACTTSDECATGSSCTSGACAPVNHAGNFTVLGSGGCASGGSGSLLPLCVLAFFAIWRLSKRRSRKSASVLVALAIAAGNPSAARAQNADTSLIVDRFQPGAGAYDILGIGSAQTADHLAFHLSAFIDYANQPLRIVSNSDPNDRVILLRYQSMLYLGASIGLFDRYELGFVLPTLIAQNTGSTTLLGPTATTAGSGVGDLKFVPKIKIYGGKQIFVAVAVPFTLPTGAGHPYLSEGYVTASPEARLETNQDWLPVRLMGNAGISFRKGHNLGDLHLGNAFTWGGGGLLPFMISGQKFAGMATINGEIGLALNHRGERPIEADAALRWYSPSSVSLTIGAGPGISDGYGTPRFRLFAGLAYDPEKAPPPAPPAAPCVCAACLLAEDVFLTTESGRSVAVPIHAMAQSGQPVKPLRTIPPTHGKLEQKEDGSLTYVPNAGFVGKDEATLILSDDGTRTAREKVFVDVLPPPPPPEPVAALPLAPLPLPEMPPPAPPTAEPERVIRNGHYALLAAVHFAIDKAIILPESFAILDKVGKILRDEPGFKKVRIEGHTDSQGKAEHNRQLSMRRATSVLNYLAKKNAISKARLVAAGFGPDFPIDTNDTADGRARNRRVEFVVIEGVKPGEEIKDTPPIDSGASKP
jgi:uncharacterized repeat protein (TIGR01451 family)